MYKLEKPCTEQEKTNFIFRYGQDCFQEGFNLRIEETENFYYALEENEILDGDTVIIDPEYEARHLAEIKQDRILENDSLRDVALNQGVTYNNVLFDSDTDQKANLSGAVLQMNDTDTVEWYGMNNDSLACSKQDLLNIGGLITQLQSFCWTKNAEIKEHIASAQTVEEVEAIEINYENNELLAEDDVPF